MEEIRDKLLDSGIRFELVMIMTDEELIQSQSYENKYDLENYLLALAIIYEI